MKKLTFSERFLISQALNRVVECIQRDEKEPDDSPLAYIDNGDFIMSMDKSDYDALLSGFAKLKRVLL